MDKEQERKLSEERRLRRNEQAKARRAALTEEQRVRRNEQERARSAVQTEERRAKRNEQARAKRAAETEEQKSERRRKRNEKDRARRAAKKNSDPVTPPMKCQRYEYEPTELFPPQKHQKRECSPAMLSSLPQKRQRSECDPAEDDIRDLRLEQMRAYHNARMEAETPEETSGRLERMRDIQSMRLPMESDEERSRRLEHMSTNQHQRLAAENDEEREARLEQLRENRQVKFPQLDQHHVQVKMLAFHKDMATIQTPMCTICMEQFPAMKVNTNSQCQRCARDKHTPGLFSAENNMHPGSVPIELEVSRCASCTLSANYMNYSDLGAIITSMHHHKNNLY